MAENPGRSVARPAVEQQAAESSPVLGKFSRTFPALQKFLEEKRESRTYQRTGCLTLFVEQGSYKCVLNDRPKQRSCFLTARTLAALFELANVGLESGQLEWRSKGYKPR